MQNISSLDDIKLVFFDLETSGFETSADILQIAAKCEKYIFCKYVKPTKPISPFATEITGLMNVDGELFLHNKRVESLPLKEILRKFKEWLDVLRPCFFVAHNGQRFDVPRLILAMENNSMIEDFKNLIVGFIDTLPILKKLHPQRKGKGKFQLSTLAQDLLKTEIELTENFHEVSYDVKILEKIALTKISKESLIEKYEPFKESFDHAIQLQKEAEHRRSLDVLKNVISKGTIRKIAKMGINFAKLQNTYKESGREGVDQLLSNKQEDNKPRVTIKNKKILENIKTFLDNQSTDIV